MKISSGFKCFFQRFIQIILFMGNQIKQNYISLRIISIRKKSPLYYLLQPLFDFILNVTHLKYQNEIKIEEPIQIQQFQSKFKKYQNKTIRFKVYSAKQNTFRQIQFTPNSNWNGSEDLIGIQVRQQKFQNIQNSFFYIKKVEKHLSSKLKEGDFIIGVVQFMFSNSQDFIQKIYTIYYDKNKPNKKITLIVYDIKNDEIQYHSISLNRNQKTNKLLGCEFSNGYLNRFPQNIEQYRKKLIQKQRKQKQIIKSRKQLQENKGSSLVLVQGLTRRGVDKNKMRKIVKIGQPFKRQQKQQSENIDNKQQNENEECKSILERINNLEQRVSILMRTMNRLTDVKQIELNKIDIKRQAGKFN